MKLLSPSMSPSPLVDMPEDVLGRFLSLMPLQLLVPACTRLKATCRTLYSALRPESLVWTVLLPLVGGTAARPAGRRSARLAEASPEEQFQRAWKALLQRCEALHHAVACAGQDFKDLSVPKLKSLAARFGTPMVDRPSPVYNGTLLMEVCRARDLREHSLMCLAEFCIYTLGADPSAHPSGSACTPLIITGARGIRGPGWPRAGDFCFWRGRVPRP